MNIQIQNMHRQAMEFADQAFVAKISGNKNQACEMWRKAFDLEREAALAVAGDLSAEPTRSVLLRSAASLAMDCGEMREAERLITMALSGHPPQEIAEELRDLYEQVNFQRKSKVKRNMNRGHLIERVAKKASVSKVAADQLLDIIFAEMAEALKRGEKVIIKDLLTLSVTVQQSRNVRNPQTGELIKLEEKKAIRAKAGKKLETMLNEKRFAGLINGGFGQAAKRRQSGKHSEN